jgi:hypothetical protein
MIGMDFRVMHERMVEGDRERKTRLKELEAIDAASEYMAPYDKYKIKNRSTVNGWYKEAVQNINQLVLDQVITRDDGDEMLSEAKAEQEKRWQQAEDDAAEEYQRDEEALAELKERKRLATLEKKRLVEEFTIDQMVMNTYNHLHFLMGSLITRTKKWLEPHSLVTAPFQTGDIPHPKYKHLTIKNPYDSPSMAGFLWGLTKHYYGNVMMAFKEDLTQLVLKTPQEVKDMKFDIMKFFKPFDQQHDAWTNKQNGLLLTQGSLFALIAIAVNYNADIRAAGTTAYEGEVSGCR